MMLKVGETNIIISRWRPCCHPCVLGNQGSY